MTFRLTHIEVLLIYIFATYREVSPYADCGYYTCFDGYCCFPSCCYDDRDEGLPVWFIPTMIGIGAAIFFTCVVVACHCCTKSCRGSHRPGPQEPTRNFPVATISTAPPLPTAPPLMQASEPPPYDEVVGKPYVYPASMEQPPCYFNIAMEDLSSEITRHPGLIPKIDSES